MNRFKRTLKLFFLLTMVLTCRMSAQKGFKIKGLWECYTALADTIDPEELKLWYQFNDSRMSVLFLPAIGLPPEKAAFKSVSKYTFKNDTLTVIGKGKKEQIRITVHNTDLISFLPDPGISSERVYLKRVKGKR